MESYNCTLCERINMGRYEAITHIYYDHLNFSPFKCHDCGYVAYSNTMKECHQNEEGHTMIEAPKYKSNFRIFTIIFLDMKYAQRYGEEFLDDCRINRPHANYVAINKDNFNKVSECNESTNENKTNNNFKDDNKSDNKVTDIQNIDTSKETKMISNKITVDIFPEMQVIYSPHSTDSNEINDGKSSSCSSISQNENKMGTTKVIEKDQERKLESLSFSIKNNEIVDSFNFSESHLIQTKKRSSHPRITYDKEALERLPPLPVKRRRLYNILCPRKPNRKYCVEYGFIFDSTELFKLFRNAKITRCKMCKRDINNAYDITRHITIYHDSEDEFKSPMFSCFLKCKYGCDDISDLKKHVKEFHNSRNFFNNVDTYELGKDKSIRVNITDDALQKYHKIFIECFPNIILKYLNEPLEDDKEFQLFLSYSSSKSDYLNSEYLIQKAKRKENIICKICNKGVPSDKYLIRHVLQNHMEDSIKDHLILACQECQKPKYYDLCELENHWNENHKNVGEFFNNFHTRFENNPMKYTCVCTTLSKENLKMFESKFEEAYPELSIE